MRKSKADKKKVTPPSEDKAQNISKAPQVDMKWKVILFVFGFLLYAQTVNFEYALDDKIVIISNQITTRGFDGVMDHFFYDSMDGFWAEQYGIDVADLDKDALVAGGRYRPLSLVSYAIEYELFGENPWWSHLINALLYGATGLVLFHLMMRLFPSSLKKDIWKTIPFWTTLLFLAHPLHVEVVANIKGRDEILSLLFGLMALIQTLKYVDSRNNQNLIWAFGLLFLSLMSKETTIAFVALGPLMMYFFDIGKMKDWNKSFVVLLGAGVLYTLIRYMVIGGGADTEVTELMNDPFLYANGSERLATIFLVFAAYIKLLFMPFPLTHDYYPYHLPFLEDGQQYAIWSDLGVIAGVLIMLGLLWVIIKGFKRKSIYAFAALFFLGTAILISNLFFPIGVFMNERFMYAPSIGMLMALTYFLLEELPAKAKSFKPVTAIGLMGVVTIVFSGMTLSRSQAWKNDATLALTDVATSTGSAKANMAAGDALIKEISEEKNPDVKTEMINEAYGYLKTSLDIYPEYFPPLDLLGKLYFESGNYAESIKFYGYCVERKPTKQSFKDNIFYIGNKLAQELRYEEAVQAYDKALTYSPNDKRYLLAAAQVFARDLKNPSRALPYMEKAYQFYPNDADVAEKLAITYAMLNRYPDAIQILEPLYQANPNNASIMKNLGIAYYQSGQIERGTILVEKSQTLNQPK
ncbi:tetratricopeptide repeat protein [bacterium SCSIO 12643]|nr:tetratricopeptide repeat protein [bacterium SCSIO 12643]